MKAPKIIKSLAWSALSILGFSSLASADPIETHRKQLLEISKKTDRFEQQFADLQTRKMQAREGEELEMVISDIGKTHKNLMELRRERNALREHLNKEHPDSPLIYDSTLYKNFDKTHHEKGPLDNRLDDLLKLMKDQYGQYIANTPQEQVAQKKAIVKETKEAPDKPGIKKEITAEPEAEVVPVQETLSTEDTKNRYMRDQIKTEMKIQALDPAAAKKKAKADAAEKSKEEAAEKAEHAAKPAAHH